MNTKSNQFTNEPKFPTALAVIYRVDLLQSVFSDSYSVILNRHIIPVVHIGAHLLQWLML